MAQSVKVITRATASNATATNPAYGASDTSTNKGAALTLSEMDMNLLNIKDAVEGNSTRMDAALKQDGTLKDLVIDGGDLSANSVDYSKIKSVHYGVDGGSAANAMTFAAAGLAALEDGMLFLVKVKNANTGAITLEVTGSSGSLGAKSVYKNKNTPLISGDLKAGEMVGMLYDLSNTAFQLLGGGVEDSIALTALASQASGNLISFATGGGAPVLVPAGSGGQVLTANSNSAPPSFQDMGWVPMLEVTHANLNSHWVVPSGVTKIRVCLQGAGAGGAWDDTTSAGGGGGGGAYVEAELTVTAGQVFRLLVGAGSCLIGTSSPSPQGTPFPAGGATSFSQITGSSSTNLTATNRATAPGGSGATDPGSGFNHIVGGAAGVAPALTSPYNAAGTTNYTKVANGQPGGARGLTFYGGSNSGTTHGGHGGASYKGQGALGGEVAVTQDAANITTVQDGVEQVHAANKQLRGSGYGWGGAGRQSDQVYSMRGGSGWGAVYDIS